MRKLSEWTERHPLLYAGAFMLIYFSWFMLLEKFAQPIIYIHSRLDYKIPFVKYFIIPYLLWFAYIFGGCVFFLIKSRVDYHNVTRYLFTGMIAALVIYTFIPNGVHLRPVVADTDIFSRLVSTIYQSDTATNVCPSLHVYNSIAMNTVIQRSNAFKHEKTVKAASWILCIAICLSTVFLKQHSVIDVFWAIVMAFILYPVSLGSVAVRTKVPEVARQHAR